MMRNEKKDKSNKPSCCIGLANRQTSADIKVKTMDFRELNNYVYIDKKGVQIFDDFGGQNVKVDVLLPIPPDSAFDEWLREIWMNGGHGFPGTNVIIQENGSGRGLLGCVRRSSGHTIIEKIIRVGEPNKDTSKIPSIQYTAIGGMLPVNEYTALVRFIPVKCGDQLCTYLVWELKFVPSWFGYACCCGGVVMKLILRHALAIILEAFRDHENDRLLMRRKRNTS